MYHTKRRPAQAGERKAPPVRAPTTGHRVRFRKGGSSGPHRTRYQPSTRGERVVRVVKLHRNRWAGGPVRACGHFHFLRTFQTLPKLAWLVVASYSPQLFWIDRNCSCAITANCAFEPMHLSTLSLGAAYCHQLTRRTGEDLHHCIVQLHGIL